MVILLLTMEPTATERPQKSHDKDLHQKQVSQEEVSGESTSIDVLPWEETQLNPGRESNFVHKGCRGM